MGKNIRRFQNRLSLFISTLLVLSLVSSLGMAQKKPIRPKADTTCMTPGTLLSEDNSSSETIGPDEVDDDGLSDRPSPGVDEVDDEFPSRGNNNYDGSCGAGGPWSDQF